MSDLISQQDNELHLKPDLLTANNENNAHENKNATYQNDTRRSSDGGPVNAPAQEDHKNDLAEEEEPVCYNQVLDNEIRNRLNKLNGLSDLINSLEREFDEANSVFREILKCSTDRLSSIAKTLGNKSIQQGRIYLDAKLSVEQSQHDCQKACLQFEQANKDHQVAKKAIKEAELKLKEVNSSCLSSTGSPVKENGVMEVGQLDIDFTKLNIHNNTLHVGEPVAGPSMDFTRNQSKDSTYETIACDKISPINEISSRSTITPPLVNEISKQSDGKKNDVSTESSSPPTIEDDTLDINGQVVSPTKNILTNAALLSEELNQSIQKLIEAEKKRGLSQKRHLDEANKLMIAQENLIRLKREHGPAIRRSQLYFEEARRFNAKLNTIKLKIDRISENITSAKQAYAQTLSGLEQFSDELHSRGLTSSSTSTTVT